MVGISRSKVIVLYAVLSSIIGRIYSHLRVIILLAFLLVFGSWDQPNRPWHFCWFSAVRINQTGLTFNALELILFAIDGANERSTEKMGKEARMNETYSVFISLNSWLLYNYKVCYNNCFVSPLTNITSLSREGPKPKPMAFRDEFWGWLSATPAIWV